MGLRHLRGIALAGIVAVCDPAAALEPAAVRENAVRPAYVAGELLVKFKPAAGKVVERSVLDGRYPNMTGLEWLDELNRRYGVARISKVFARAPDPEEVARQFPERARRAPPGVNAPTLTYIYKLTMSHHVDVLQAARDYAAHPDVEYAEPNSLATTQPR